MTDFDDGSRTAQSAEEPNQIVAIRTMGKRAGRLGLPDLTNPFSAGTPLALAWRQGWNEGRSERTEPKGTPIAREDRMIRPAREKTLDREGNRELEVGEIESVCLWCGRDRATHSKADKRQCDRSYRSYMGIRGPAEEQPEIE